MIPAHRPAGVRVRAAGLLAACLLGAGCAAPSGPPPAPAAGPTAVAAPEGPARPAERLAPGVHRTEVAGQEAVIVVPERPNGGLVVYLHGYRGSAQAIDGGGPLRALVDGLVGAGYAVAASDAHGDAWGSAASVDAHAALAAAARASAGADDVFLVADSMGGLAGAQLVTGRRIEGLRAYAGLAPLCDLGSVYRSFADSVDAAHGAGGGEALDRLSPVRLDADVPVRLWASGVDTVVARDRNADVCAGQVVAGGGSARVVPASGEHGDPSHYDLAGLLAFFASAAG